MEIKWYVTGAPHEPAERFDWREFASRVAEIEGVDRGEAAYHAQVIVDAHGWTVDLVDGDHGGAIFEVRGVDRVETSLPSA